MIRRERMEEKMERRRVRNAAVVGFYLPTKPEVHWTVGVDGEMRICPIEQSSGKVEIL